MSESDYQTERLIHIFNSGINIKENIDAKIQRYFKN